MIAGDAEPAAAARAILEQNARHAGLTGARIHVASGPYGGLRVRVVHDGLGGMTDEERRGKLLSGIEAEVTEPELVTSAEEEWYGEAFVESAEPIPTWSDVLELSATTTPLTFVSDLDHDLPIPAIVTFYSLRGGVGRTTALAAAARILAKYWSGSCGCPGPVRFGVGGWSSCDP
jgi:hypothetical protein